MRKNLILILLCLVSLFTYSQNKLGHINSEELVSLMPELQNVQTELTKIQEKADVTYKGMLQEYQNKVIAYQNDEKNLSGPTLDARQKEIIDLENRIAQFEQASQKSFQDKYVELLQPIQEKAVNAINDIAKSQKYTYIFDISKDNILFYENGDNILPLVKQKLKL